MKWILSIGLLVGFLIFLPVGNANLYNQDSVILKLQVEGQFELQPEHAQAQLEEVRAEFLLYPQTRESQQLVQFTTDGIVEGEKVIFKWDDGTLGTKEYGYSSVIKTTLDRLPVREKIKFPIDQSKVGDLEEYLLPTLTIDSDNPAVRAKAAELAQGQDDLFVVAFTLAHWVESNVEYDLNTLTESASQKASWVLENRQGVCDEMTTLFVAMVRSLGIPARFVSGVSYTTSPLFTENWQPHGWAEVYFPDVGWVSFDITFGEYGYVDATHIRLRDSDDPAEPATRFEWVSEGVALKSDSSSIDFNIDILETGMVIPEGISIESAILGKEIDFGSYNIVKATLHNTQDFYAATTLQLSVPTEIEVLGRNTVTKLLRPQETAEVSWAVRVNEKLNTEFRYTFPIIIASERNTTVEDVFYAQTGKLQFSKRDIEQLIEVHEEKIYSRKVGLLCDYPTTIAIGAKGVVECTLKNTGNTNLEDVNFCLDGVCEQKSLLINQQTVETLTLKTGEAGYKNIIVTAENEEIEKRLSLEYLVYDEPSLRFTVDIPREADYGDDFTIGINLEKTSFVQPAKIEVRLEGVGFENRWSISELQDTQDIQMQLSDYPLGYSNTFVVNVEWHDLEGKTFQETRKISLKGTPTNVMSRVAMIWNQVVAVLA